MRYCVIKVGDFSYSTFSPSTCEAVADALKRFPHARSVSVRTRLHASVAGILPASPDPACGARRHAQSGPEGLARLAVAGDAAGQLGWGRGLAYCAPALH